MMFKKIVLSTLLGLFSVCTILTQSSFAQFGPDDNFPPPPPDDEIGAPPPPMQGNQGKFGKCRRGKFGKHNDGMMQMFKDLNLTETQKEELKSHHEKSREQIKGLKEQVMKERMALMDTLMDPYSTKEQMLNKVDAFNKMKLQMEKVRIENLAYMKTVLTEEQKAKLKTILAEHKIKMQEKMKKFKQMREQRKNRFSEETKN